MFETTYEQATTDDERTALRFRPAPNWSLQGGTAVWSGDTVRMDEDGFVYFIGRDDDMIKVSGYRVSPDEVEQVIYATGLVTEAAAIGIPHATGIAQAAPIVSRARNARR